MASLSPARRPLSPLVFCLLIPCVLAGLVVVAFIALRIAGFVEPFQMPTVSMAPGLCKGDLFVGQGVALAFRSPHRGEIVVFDPQKVPSLWAAVKTNGMWIKRIVAVPCDRFQVKDGQVWINGARATDLGEHKYIASQAVPGMSNGIDIAKETLVPEGQYIALGDNTANSLDSRYWGLLPAASIKFVYWFSYWKTPDRPTAMPKR